MTYPNVNLSFDEEKIKELVAKSLMEGMTAGLTEAIDEVPAPLYPQDKITTNSLDVEDTLRMENFLLQQQVESLTRSLEDNRREKMDNTLTSVRKGLESFLAKKHQVDTDSFKISLDPNKYTLSIIPLRLTDVVAANNKGN